MHSLASGVGFLDLNFQQVPRIIATAVLHGPGGVALVDPGPSSALPALRRQLSDAGIAISDVTMLLLTHIHLDHAGASGTLVREHPDLQVYVHEAGAPHLVNPEKLLASATRLWGDEMDTLWGEVLAVPSERLTILTRRRAAARRRTAPRRRTHAGSRLPSRQLFLCGIRAGICRRHRRRTAGAAGICDAADATAGHRHRTVACQPGEDRGVASRHALSDPFWSVGIDRHAPGRASARISNWRRIWRRRLWAGRGPMRIARRGSSSSFVSCSSARSASRKRVRTRPPIASISAGGAWRATGASAAPERTNGPRIVGAADQRRSTAALSVFKNDRPFVANRASRRALQSQSPHAQGSSPLASRQRLRAWASWTFSTWKYSSQ